MLAALGLCCCTQAFSSYSEQGQLSGCCVRASHHGGFSGCGPWSLGVRDCVAVVRGLRCPLAAGISLEWRSHLRPLHWQAGSQPLARQGGPPSPFLSLLFLVCHFAFSASALLPSSIVQVKIWEHGFYNQTTQGHILTPPLLALRPNLFPIFLNFCILEMECVGMCT